MSNNLDLASLEAWRSDPRMKEALNLIGQLVDERGAELAGVVPPDPQRAEETKASLDAFAELRGGGLYYPYLSTGVGKGPWVQLADGSVKLDFITGIGVHGLGHSHPDLREAGVVAAALDTVMQGNLQQFEFSIDACRGFVELARLQGGNIQHLTLSTSGAMANENALKLAFHARPGAHRILAFEHCFAGRTLALSQLTDKAAYRVGLPPTIVVDYLPFFDQASPDESTARTLAGIENYLKRYPEGYGAIWIELIQGEGGYNPGDTEYFNRILAPIRERKIPIIFDEVQTFGRTSQPFAFQHFQQESMADIVTFGKISQVCGTLFTPEFKPGPGLISQTFTGGTWEILASQVVIQTLMGQGHFGDEGRNMAIHSRFARGLDELAQKYPNQVHGPWGLGGMIALTPLDGRPEQAKRLAHVCYEEGLMTFVAGAQPSRIRFLPPLAVTEDEHIDLALEILDRALRRLIDESSQA